MKLLIRGGSIAAGFGVQRSYVDMLGAFLPDIEIINRSGIKDTSFQGIWTFHEDIDPFKPNILLLHFGIDDAYNPVYRSEFKENLVQIVRLARNRFNPDIMLLTSHPFEDQYEMDMINIYYRTIQEVAADLNCGIIPMHAYWMGTLIEEGSKISAYVQEDYRYPNESGHELYAKAILPKIQQYIQAERS